MIPLILLHLAQVDATASGPAAPARAVTPAIPPRSTAPRIAPIDPAEAVELFRTTCAAHIGDEGGFAVAMASAPIPFDNIARRGARPGQSWRADRALVSYGATPDGATRCTLVGRIRGSVDQLTFAARIATAFGLKAGRTRAAGGQAVTDWTVAGPDGRPVALSAATRSSAAGGTDIRLSVTLAR